EVPELQKGPAADALVLAEPQLRHEITDGGFKVGNGQYVLGFDDAEGHVSLRVCRPSPSFAVGWRGQHLALRSTSDDGVVAFACLASRIAPRLIPTPTRTERPRPMPPARLSYTRPRPVPRATP